MERALPAAKNPLLMEKGITGYDRLITFVKDRPGHDRRYAINSSKIRRELGWKEKHGFESGMEETVRWYLSHQDWCKAVQKGKYQRQRLGLVPGGRRPK